MYVIELYDSERNNKYTVSNVLYDSNGKVATINCCSFYDGYVLCKHFNKEECEIVANFMINKIINKKDTHLGDTIKIIKIL